MDDRRGDALAKNEVLFREVNEQVERIDQQRGTSSSELTSFLCECARTSCLERVAVTRAEYESVRMSPIRFLLVHGHDEPSIETVVESNERFVVVEKRPGERDVPRATDPATRRGWR